MPTPPLPRLLLLSVALVLAAPGCAKFKERKNKGKTPTPEALITKSKSYSASVKSVIGEAKVDYFDRNAGADGRIKGKTLFLIERPNQLRFDVLTPFDSPIATLVSDGKCLSLLDLSQKVFVQGDPTPENIERLFQLSVSGDDIVRALLGETPIMPDPEKQTVTYSRGAWVLTLTKQGEVQELRFDADNFQLQSSTLTQGGKVEFKITYDGYEKVEGTKATLPRIIFFEKPSEKSDLKIKVVGDLEINQTISPEALTLAPPNGIEIIGSCP
jgi:outer membrane lipoprotein-sorting protein